MPDGKKADGLGGIFPIENSDYKTLYWLEHEEIKKNMYYLSQASGTEITYEHAMWNWHFCHRDAWIKGIRTSGDHLT